MPLSFIILAILLIVGYGLAHYYQEMRPYSPKVLFNRIKEGYNDVKSGSLSYTAFKEGVKNECSMIKQKESAFVVRFKQSIISMLNHDDFIHNTLSDPDLTMDKLFAAWREYEPPTVSEIVESAVDGPEEEVPLPEVEDKIIPEVFANGPGKEVMDMMVDHGYCASSSYEWIYDGENSSYLMALFADAIGRHLKFRRERWKPFSSIWGERNYPDRFAKASECPNVDYLVEKVKELFPEYKGQM